MIPPESCHVRVLVVALALVLRRRVESTNVSTVSVSLPTVAAPFVSLPTVAANLISLPTVAANPVSLPIVAAEPVSLPTVAATIVSLQTVAANIVSLPTVAAEPVRLPTVAAADVSLSFVSASALGTIPDVSLNMSAAPRRKRTRQSRPASTNIFPVDVSIDTIQKFQDRDGNESDTSYYSCDVITDDSIVEEERRLDADLAQYNQVRRNLTDRDEVEDSDSRDILWASNRAPSPVEPDRETTNERVSSVVDIPTSQP